MRQSALQERRRENLLVEPFRRLAFVEHGLGSAVTLTLSLFSHRLNHWLPDVFPMCRR